MKRIILSIFLIAALLAACATSQHTVDHDGLSSVKGQTFHVGSVQIPCYSIEYISRLPFQGCGRDCQIALLNNIPTDDILQKLSESYGITIAKKEKLTIESSITNLVMAAVSDSAGRCFFMQGSTPSANANSIDIEFTLSTSNFPTRITVGYEVTVLSSKKILIKHQNEMKTFKYMGNDYNETMKNVRDSAGEITSALERDIALYRSKKP